MILVRYKHRYSQHGMTQFKVEALRERTEGYFFKDIYDYKSLSPKKLENDLTNFKNVIGCYFLFSSYNIH